jgi:hypothetical protein
VGPSPYNRDKDSPRTEQCAADGITHGKTNCHKYGSREISMDSLSDTSVFWAVPEDKDEHPEKTASPQTGNDDKPTDER